VFVSAHSPGADCTVWFGTHGVRDDQIRRRGIEIANVLQEAIRIRNVASTWSEAVRLVLGNCSYRDRSVAGKCSPASISMDRRSEHRRGNANWAELESLMMKWHSDLYGELSAICIAMQVGPDSGARDTWNDYLERYVAWNYALPHETLPIVYRNPDLVGEIYIWETSHQGGPRLFHLNLDTRKIEPSQVPLELPNLLARLKKN
jgi:hypothetical protein